MDDTDGSVTPSFASWYRQQHPRLLASLTVMTGNADLAREVAADAFAIAYERWERVAGLDSPGGWLQRVAVNKARRRQRRAALERRLLGRYRHPEPPPALAAEVWDAVRVLPPRQRTAIALRYLLDLPQAEVAAVMGVSPGTVSATLTAARRRLAPLLHPDAETLERSRA